MDSETPKTELAKLGTGHDIDLAKLWEEMEEDRMDRMLAVLRELREERQNRPSPPAS
jgi:hypothetical protein